MPFVNIKIRDEGVSAGKKTELVKGETDLLVRVLGKTPATTFVAIEEIKMDNRGIYGETITARRAPGGGE